MTKCKTKLKMWHPHSTKINKTYGFKNDQVCHMNPSKDLPSNEFNEVFEQWISRSADGNPHMGPMHLESHYMVDPLLEFDNLKDIVNDHSRNINFLNNKSQRTFIVFLITYSLSKDPDVSSLIDWKNVLLSLLSMKVAFKAIICICKQKYFYKLFITLQEKYFKD